MQKISKKKKIERAQSKKLNSSDRILLLFLYACSDSYKYKEKY